MRNGAGLLGRGFLYVLAWRPSNTLDADFCMSALEEALERGTPQIFNTDQGSQFTGEAFTGTLKQHGVGTSMNGRGRYADPPERL